MNMTPAHRNSDPVTSYLGDKHITQSGKRLSYVRMLEAYVKNNQGWTAREIARDTGIDYEITHKRLADSNKLEKGRVRKCSISGHPAAEWNYK